MKTFENLRKSLGYSDPCSHFYIPHITIGYFPMNEEELKWNTKPVLEKYLNLKYPGVNILAHSLINLLETNKQVDKSWKGIRKTQFMNSLAEISQNSENIVRQICNKNA